MHFLFLSFGYPLNTKILHLELLLFNWVGLGTAYLVETKNFLLKVL